MRRTIRPIALLLAAVIVLAGLSACTRTVTKTVVTTKTVTVSPTRDKLVVVKPMLTKPKAKVSIFTQAATCQPSTTNRTISASQIKQLPITVKKLGFSTKFPVTDLANRSCSFTAFSGGASRGSRAGTAISYYSSLYVATNGKYCYSSYAMACAKSIDWENYDVFNDVPTVTGWAAAIKQTEPSNCNGHIGRFHGLKAMICSQNIRVQVTIVYHRGHILYFAASGQFANQFLSSVRFN